MILNVSTRKWMNGFIARPTVALLIDSGNDVIGGLELAEEIYNRIAGDNASPLITVSLKEKNSIGIDEIRELRQSLGLRATRSEGISRMVVLAPADSLTTEAQNALLKLIEEMPERTAICLVAERPARILPTLRSRCFTVPLLPLSEAQVVEYAKSMGVESNQAKLAYGVADGNFTTVRSLLTKEGGTLKSEIDTAKLFLAQSVFDRQGTISQFKESQQQVPIFMRSLMTVAKAGMRHAKSRDSKRRWKDIVKEILAVQRLLETNVSPKLALLRLTVTI